MSGHRRNRSFPVDSNPCTVDASVPAAVGVVFCFAITVSAGAETDSAADTDTNAVVVIGVAVAWAVNIAIRSAEREGCNGIRVDWCGK